MSFKNFVRLYKMNRLWGDNIFEALYWAFRGKAFTASYRNSLLDKQIITELETDDSWPTWPK